MCTLRANSYNSHFESLLMCFLYSTNGGFRMQLVQMQYVTGSLCSPGDEILVCNNATWKAGQHGCMLVDTPFADTLQLIHWRWPMRWGFVFSGKRTGSRLPGNQEQSFGDPQSTTDIASITCAYQHIYKVLIYRWILNQNPQIIYKIV